MQLSWIIITTTEAASYIRNNLMHCKGRRHPVSAQKGNAVPDIMIRGKPPNIFVQIVMDYA
jgi:hypothetical protein